jgi:hypothetical protein
MVGWLGPVKLASPMMASTLDVGTPLDQLLAVFQAVLVTPFQLVWEYEVRQKNKNGIDTNGARIIFANVIAFIETKNRFAVQML